MSEIRIPDGDKGDRFEIVPMIAWDAFLLHPRLAPIAGDLLRLYGLFINQGVQLLQQGIDPAKLEENLEALIPLMAPSFELAMPIINDLCKKLPRAELEDIVKNNLLARCSMNGTPLFGDKGAFDLLMAKRTFDVWRLIVFATKENYPDFFGLFAAKPRPPQKEIPPSEASST